jgi:hypothetical protein
MRSASDKSGKPRRCDLRTTQLMTRTRRQAGHWDERDRRPVAERVERPSHPESSQVRLARIRLAKSRHRRSRSRQQGARQQDHVDDSGGQRPRTPTHHHRSKGGQAERKRTAGVERWLDIPECECRRSRETRTFSLQAMEGRSAGRGGGGTR